jgi:inner membrane protein
MAQALDLGAAALAGLAASALLGARLPDADVDGARIHRRTLAERRSWPVYVVGTIVRLPLLLARGLRHRGITHSLAACAVASLIVGFIASLAGGSPGVLVGAGVALGYLTHIAIDACTPGGVCPWAPFRWSPAWLVSPAARIRTGGVGEFGFAVVFAVLATCALAIVA